MTISMGRLAAMLLMAAVAMPLAAGSQDPDKKKEDEAKKAAPAKPAAPAAKPAAPAGPPYSAATASRTGSCTAPATARRARSRAAS